MGNKTTLSTSIHSSGRVVFLDYLRALACLTVIIVHSCEFFYIGGDDPLCIKSLTDLHWANLIDSLFRPSVPLFVLASSYLLFPLRDDTATFFKRRFTRVAIPFIIWLVLYAVIPQYGGSCSAPLQNCSPGRNDLCRQGRNGPLRANGIVYEHIPGGYAEAGRRRLFRNPYETHR